MDYRTAGSTFGPSAFIALSGLFVIIQVILLNGNVVSKLFICFSLRSDCAFSPVTFNESSFVSLLSVKALFAFLTANAWSDLSFSYLARSFRARPPYAQVYQ